MYNFLEILAAIFVWAAIQSLPTLLIYTLILGYTTLLAAATGITHTRRNTLMVVYLFPGTTALMITFFLYKMVH